VSLLSPRGLEAVRGEVLERKGEGARVRVEALGDKGLVWAWAGRVVGVVVAVVVTNRHDSNSKDSEEAKEKFEPSVGSVVVGRNNRFGPRLRTWSCESLFRRRISTATLL